MQDRPLLQEHVVHEHPAERFEFMTGRQTAGEQQETDLFVAEAALLDGAVDDVADVILAEEQPALRGDDALGGLVITDDVADLGKADEHTGAVFVTKTALDVILLEEFEVDLGTLHQVSRKTSNKFVSANHRV